jgi:hypothetical protein
MPELFKLQRIKGPEYFDKQAYNCIETADPDSGGFSLHEKCSNPWNGLIIAKNGLDMKFAQRSAKE